MKASSTGREETRERDTFPKLYEDMDRVGTAFCVPGEEPSPALILFEALLVVACACFLGLGPRIATPLLRARSRSLLRKLDRIRPDRVNWHSLKEVAGFYAAHFPPQTGQQLQETPCRNARWE